MHFATVLNYITEVEASVQPGHTPQLYGPLPLSSGSEIALETRHAEQPWLCLHLTPGHMFIVSVP